MDVFFLIEDDDLLEKYNTIQNKVSTDITKKFDSKPVYSKQYLKTKIKPHDDKVTDLCEKKNPNVDSDYSCVAVTSLESALKKDDSYYL